VLVKWSNILCLFLEFPKKNSCESRNRWKRMAKYKLWKQGCGICVLVVLFFFVDV
jgi:hypothetical protein